MSTTTDDTFDLGPMRTVPFNPERARDRAWQGIATGTAPVPTRPVGREVR